jgi:hypothetical protein
MLERLAYDFITLDSVPRIAITLLVLASGFGIALHVHREDSFELRRMPYLVLYTALFFGGKVLGFTWFLDGAAIKQDLLWTIVLFVLLMMFFSGYAAGYLSSARARNAYGSSRKAFYGIVPVANVILMGRPPLYPDLSASGGARTAMNVAGVILAGLLFGAGGFVEMQIDRLSEQHYEQLAADPQIQEKLDADLARRLIESDDIAAVLARIAQEAALPVVIDESTTITAITADGSTLRRTFRVTGDELEMDQGFRESIRQTVCGFEFFKNLIDKGASIEESYVRTDGLVIGVHTVSGNDCYL